MHEKLENVFLTFATKTKENKKKKLLIFLPEVMMTRFSIRECIAIGKSSHKTAKWSYLDHPVSTNPRKDNLLVLRVSLLITSSHAKLLPTCLCTLTAYNRSPNAPLNVS